MAVNTKILDGIRWYECAPDDWYPSVTSILKVTGNSAPILANWRRSLGDEADTLSQQARDRGTSIHEFAERRLRGYRVARAVPKHLRPYWDSLKPVLKRCSHRRMTEQFVWHRGQHYAGTLDAVCRFGKTPLTLLDWKTTKDTSTLDKRLDEYRLQVTAYAAALLDHDGIEVHQGAIVVAHPDGPAHVEIVTRQDMTRLWDEWCERCQAFPAAIAAVHERREEKRAAIVDAFQWNISK